MTKKLLLKLKIKLFDFLYNNLSSYFSKDFFRKDIENQVKKYLTSIQAIDHSFKETGKIIIICKVGGRDWVKIIDIPRNCDWKEYKDMILRIENAYGAKLKFFDSPYPLFQEFFRKEYNH